MTGPGMKRALVIASQIHGLTGCHNDADLVAGLLDARGFEIRSARGPEATRAGILDHYEQLIGATGPEDTVVVYYAGHGSRGTAVAARPAELRCILPTDIDETTAEDFRGVLADELSILQWRLTLRTANVTTLLDCCYSARMSRDSGDEALRARAWDAKWPAGAVARRWQTAVDGFQRLWAEYPGSGRHDANPTAVRMVASGAHQRAYEGFDPASGAVHGLFTAALVPVLRTHPHDTWDAVADRVRRDVLARMPVQRPEIEGPHRRVVFTLDEARRRPVYPVRVEDESGLAWLDAAALHGFEPGDQVLLGELGAQPDPGKAAVAIVTTVTGQRALLRRPDGRLIPAGTAAFAVRESHNHRLIVRLRSGDGEPVPRSLRDALSAVPGIRVQDEPAPGQLATIAVAAGRYLLYDAGDRPLHRSPRSVDRTGLGGLRDELLGLATSLRLRDLDVSADELPARTTLTVASAGRPLGDGAVAHIGDRLRIRVGSDPLAPNVVYANVLDLGIAGRVTVLNTAEAAGIALLPGESRALGAGPEGHDPGIPLSWPASVPDGGPRFETVLAVFSDEPQDLRGLAHDGVRGHGTRLSSLLWSGGRDLAPASQSTRYSIRRRTILLCPGGDGCTHTRA